jgi:hypothetical protein
MGVGKRGVGDDGHTLTGTWPRQRIGSSDVYG